ncbi:hypothetical protein [Flavobacterium sp. UBA7680]|uniref:hypothetical protein n=1 Tax=Flavobacterium sp. UBA7680 TaxID=1946559 RepID=UPI0025C10F44|nr:hypothetical protein [Flavobacterium sp. UBA7680]
MEEMIKNQSKVIKLGMLFSFVLFAFFCCTAYNNFNAFNVLGLFFTISGVIYCFKELMFFESNFHNHSSHLISWVYPNGDKLIVTCWGILKENKVAPKIDVKNKFEGFSWDFDNVKDLIENVTTNSGNPLSSLIPSIKFSTTSNQIENYIIFGFVDKIDITFVELDKGFIIINIEKKNIDIKYNMTYPLPSNKTSLKEEFEIFEKRINKKFTPVRALYIEKSIVDEIMMME